MSGVKKYDHLTRDDLILRLEAVDALIDLAQRELNNEELYSFPWAGNLGQWTWMIPTNNVIFNEKKARHIGYTTEDIPEKAGFEFFTDKLHPDDYDQVMDNMRQHLLGQTTAYEVEYRILRKNGSYAWYYDRGTVKKRDDNGNALIVSGIVFDISENKEMELKLKRANQKLSKLAQIDDLTSAYNKRYMKKILEKEINKLEEKSRTLSLLMIDLDDFKKVNDQYGHQVGDLLLQKLVKIIKEIIGPEDIVARWGGDEFLVLLKNKSLSHAKAKAEAIRSTLEIKKTQPFPQTTVSIGLANFEDPYIDVDEAIHLIDQLMYQAKFSGKNRIIF